MSSLALLGYGEVGRILAEDLRAQRVAVTAHDLKLGSAAADGRRAHAAQHGVVLATSHAQAVGGAGLVISAATASHAVAVASATKMCRSIVTRAWRRWSLRPSPPRATVAWPALHAVPTGAQKPTAF